MTEITALKKFENFEILLAPTAEIAAEAVKDGSFIATVEAEYGDICVEGSKYTLAHHGSRSNNPAPCNWVLEPVDGGKILVSHLDLDTLGGIFAIMGIKPENKKFWKAAEYIDVHGPHHIHKFEDEIVDLFNAYWAWNSTRERSKYDDLTVVTPTIFEHFEIINILLTNAPKWDLMINLGRKWAEEQQAATEAALVAENGCMRAFRSDIFTAASYFSPKLNKVIPATVNFNTKFDSITVAFENGGDEICSARKIVQKLWGPEAGGRDGIAGSPRGQKMTEEDFDNAIKAVEDAITEERKALNRFVTRHA